MKLNFIVLTVVGWFTFLQNRPFKLCYGPIPLYFSKITIILCNKDTTSCKNMLKKNLFILFFIYEINHLLINEWIDFDKIFFCNSGKERDIWFFWFLNFPISTLLQFWRLLNLFVLFTYFYHKKSRAYTLTKKIIKLKFGWNKQKVISIVHVPIKMIKPRMLGRENVCELIKKILRNR